MKVNVDIRFLVKSLLACALAAGAWTGLHAYQMERQRGTLLRLVDRAEAEGKQPRAARLLGQYVTLFPEEADARARYGILIETLPGTRPGRVAAVY